MELEKDKTAKMSPTLIFQLASQIHTCFTYSICLIYWFNALNVCFKWPYEVLIIYDSIIIMTNTQFTSFEPLLLSETIGYRLWCYLKSIHIYRDHVVQHSTVQIR